MSNISEGARTKLFVIIALLVLASCSPQAPATQTPTEVVIATEVVSATATIVPTEVAVSGTPMDVYVYDETPRTLGIDLDVTMGFYELLGFEFTPFSDQSGYTGLISDKLARIMIYTNEQGVWSLGVCVNVPKSPTEDQVNRMGAYLASILSNGIPEWDSSIDWLNEQMELSGGGLSYEARVIEGNKEVYYYFETSEDIYIFTLSVDAVGE